MSGNRFLLDTNILLYLIGKKLPVDFLPEGEFLVSFVTEPEVLSYPSITPNEEQQLKRFFHYPGNSAEIDRAINLGAQCMWNWIKLNDALPGRPWPSKTWRT